MLVVRKSNERGPTQMDWLKSMHSFSFGHYHDPAHMGFGPLRVINEDRVRPGAGFGTHPHNNMEIISYVLSGALEHQDSMGTGSVIKPGDIQLMSAGSGVTHSEYNASDSEEVHFLQIWVMPNVQNQAPGYQQTTMDAKARHNQFALAISPDGAGDSLRIKQDARLYTGVFDAGVETAFHANTDRKYWLQIARGVAKVNGTDVEAGDGVALTQEDHISVVARSDAEILLFDLP